MDFSLSHTPLLRTSSFLYQWSPGLVTQGTASKPILHPSSEHWLEMLLSEIWLQTDRVRMPQRREGAPLQIHAPYVTWRFILVLQHDAAAIAKWQMFQCHVPGANPIAVTCLAASSELLQILQYERCKVSAAFVPAALEHQLLLPPWGRAAWATACQSSYPLIKECMQLSPFLLLPLLSHIKAIIILSKMFTQKRYSGLVQRSKIDFFKKPVAVSALCPKGINFKINVTDKAKPQSSSSDFW